MTEQQILQPLAQVAQEQMQHAPQPPQPPKQQEPQQAEPKAQVVDQSGNVLDNPYQSIIEQQQAQIAALMVQNDALNQQVTRMVQGGAQFSQQQQTQQFAQGALSDNRDWSLESLAKDIGR